MKIGSGGIEIEGWQFCLVAGLIATMVIACTVNHMYSQSVHLQEVQASETEKTRRGHWLWGHWDDVAENQEHPAPSTTKDP